MESKNKLSLIGSDSIYKEEFIVDVDKNARKDTQGLLIAVPWHRKEYLCNNRDERLECKAARLFRENKI